MVTGDAEINITVLDFNDNTPMFLNPMTSVFISEGVSPGTVLTDFNVTDSDSGSRGVLGVVFSIAAGMVSLYYCTRLRPQVTLSVGDTDLFSVNSVSGILKTEARLDRDLGPACYFLSIQATDSAGANSLSNVTEVHCLLQWS